MEAKPVDSKLPWQRAIGPCALAVCAAVLLFAITANPAGAVFPGTNGKIAFASNRHAEGNFQIYDMGADGNNQIRLTTTKMTSYDAHASFSPDGTKMAFTSDRDGSDEIYVMNADGTNQTRLTNNSWDDALPAFSADGNKIAFTSSRDESEEIYVMDADGTNQTRLTFKTNADDVSPSYSSNGSITFTSYRDGNAEIYAMDGDGNNQTRLTHSSNTDTASSYSPSGGKIVFVSNRNGNPEIYTMNSDGTSQQRLTSYEGLDSAPTFSPDGTKVAFTSGRDGGVDIYLMNPDGGDVSILTDPTQAADWGPAWQPVLKPASGPGNNDAAIAAEPAPDQSPTKKIGGTEPPQELQRAPAACQVPPQADEPAQAARRARVGNTLVQLRASSATYAPVSSRDAVNFQVVKRGPAHIQSVRFTYPLISSTGVARRAPWKFSFRPAYAEPGKSIVTASVRLSSSSKPIKLRIQFSILPC